MGEVTRVFIDTSKQVFQLHGVDEQERPVLRRTLRRRELMAFFARLAPTRVGMEACGGAHHWARELARLGHEVVLIAPQYVKPYVKRGKNDAKDAEGGCEAMSRPTMRFVPVKSEAQQAALMLMSVRDRLIRNRTQLTNAIRGHAAEFGLVTGRGLDKVQPLLERIAADEGLPALARRLFAAQGEEYARLQAELEQVESELLAWHRQDETSRRLAAIPAVGPVSAALLAMKTPDAAAFRSARHFAAWVGLTPRDHSTAGKTRLGVITRAGDEVLRRTLVSGAMAVVRQVMAGRGKPHPWLARLLERKPPKLAAVALANKVARIAWKLMTTGQAYDPARRLAAT